MVKESIKEMVLIPEEGSFTLTAYVESPGYIRVAPTGYIISERRDGTWIAPLLPQMFYGATGTQLTTWRQYIPSAGSQVILSKPVGELLVPKEELYWRKIEPEKEVEVAVEPVRVTGLGPAITILALLGLGGALIYLSSK